jgi:hypothetical protein
MTRQLKSRIGSQRSVLTDKRQELERINAGLVKTFDDVAVARREVEELEEKEAVMRAGIARTNYSKLLLKSHKIVLRFVTVLSFVKNFQLRKRVRALHTSISGVIMGLIDGYENDRLTLERESGGDLQPDADEQVRSLEAARHIREWREQCVRLSKDYTASSVVDLVSNLRSIGTVLRACIDAQRETKLKWKMTGERVLHRNAALKHTSMRGQQALSNAAAGGSSVFFLFANRSYYALSSLPIVLTTLLLLCQSFLLRSFLFANRSYYAQ